MSVTVVVVLFAKFTSVNIASLFPETVFPIPYISPSAVESDVIYAFVPNGKSTASPCNGYW